MTIFAPPLIVVQRREDRGSQAMARRAGGDQSIEQLQVFGRDASSMREQGDILVHAGASVFQCFDRVSSVVIVKYAPHCVATR